MRKTTFFVLFLFVSSVVTTLFSQVTVYDMQEDFTSDVSNWDFVTNNGSAQTFTYNSSTKRLQARWPNGNSSWVKTLSSAVTPGTDNLVKVEFIIRGYTSGNSSNYGALYLLDSNGNAVTGFFVRRTSVGGSSKWAVGLASSYPGIATYSYPSGLPTALNADQPTAKITFDINFDTKTYSFVAQQGTFDDNTRVFTDGTVSVSYADQAFINTAASDINAFNSYYYRASSASGTNGFDFMYAGISALRNVATSDVTVKFKDQDNNYFKTEEVVTGQPVGNTYNATSTQKSSMVSGGYYYSLNPSSPTSVVVGASGTILELLFNKSVSVTDMTWNGTTNTDGDLWSESYQNFINGVTPIGHQQGANAIFDATAANKAVIVDEIIDMVTGNISIDVPDYTFTGTGVISGTGTMSINMGATDALSLGVTNNLSGQTQVAGGLITLTKPGVLGSSVSINGATSLITGANSITIPAITSSAATTIDAGTNITTLVNGMSAVSGVKMTLTSKYNYASSYNYGLDFAASGTLASGSELEINGADTDNRIGMTTASTSYLANTKLTLTGNSMFYIHSNQGAATTINVGTLAGESTAKLGWGSSSALGRTITWSVGASGDDSEYAGSITNTGGYAGGGSSYTGDLTNLTKEGTGTLTLSGTSTHNGVLTINAGTVNLTGNYGTGVTSTVASGATLKGNGTIGGNTTVNGTLEGNMNFGSDLTLAGTTKIQINGFNSGEYDVIDVTGTINNGGVLNINVAADPTVPGTLQLVNAGTYVGAFTEVNIVSPTNPSPAPRLQRVAAVASAAASYSYDPATGVLTYAPAIPSNVESQVMESQVYPALSNGNVFVKAQNVKSIDVVAISGQVVKQASPTGVLTTVNLTSLTDGVYIVRVKLNDNSVKSQRILLQK